MLESEYRQVNRSSNIKFNLNYVSKYKSSLDQKTKNISSLFAKYTKDLELDNFDTSSLNLSVEKVNNDTFLKVLIKIFKKTSLNQQT